MTYINTNVNTNITAKGEDILKKLANDKRMINSSN